MRAGSVARDANPDADRDGDSDGDSERSNVDPDCNAHVDEHAAAESTSHAGGAGERVEVSGQQQRSRHGLARGGIQRQRVGERAGAVGL